MKIVSNKFSGIYILRKRERKRKKLINIFVYFFSCEALLLVLKYFKY